MFVTEGSSGTAAESAPVVATPVVETPQGGEQNSSLDIAGAVDSIGDSLGFGKAVEGEAKTAVTEPVAEAKPAEVTEPVVAATAAPKTWKPEEAATWASIPKVAQDAIARREEDMFRGLEQYKGAANFGNTVQKTLEPYMPMLKAQGIDPVSNIKSLMDMHYYIATGDAATKLAMLQQIERDYKITRTDLGAVQENASYADPEVSALRAELQQLKSGQASLQEARQQETQAKVQSEVDAFVADPANVYFQEVGEEVARLLGMDKQLSLAKAYETAVWANPVTRAKEIARQDVEKQAKAAGEAKKKLADVQRATAGNLRIQPKAGAATLPLGTMEDTMQETLRSIKSRS